MSAVLPVAPRQLPPLPTAGGSEDLSPAQRRVVVASILLAHVAGLYALLQVHAVRQAVVQAVPMFVDILALPPKDAPPAPPPPLPPQVRPVMTKKPPPPEPLIAAAPSQAPSAFVVPTPPPEPTPAPPAVVPPAPIAVAATPPPPPAPPPAPRNIPASAVQFVVPPSFDYPRISRQRNESGLVIVRIWLDEAGVPQQPQLEKSSGFVRLDDAALKGAALARFKPYAENGRPMAGWVRLPIPFDLER